MIFWAIQSGLTDRSTVTFEMVDYDGNLWIAYTNLPEKYNQLFNQYFISLQVSNGGE